MLAETYIQWTFAWWIVDGSGLLVCGLRAGRRDAIMLGLGGIVFGAGNCALTHLWSAGVIPDTLASTVAMLGFGLVLLAARYTWLDDKRLRRAWREAGMPCTWCGAWAVGALFMTVISIAALWFTRRSMLIAEGTLWSWALGACAASASSMGAYGVSMSYLLRWFVRITVPCAFVSASYLLLTRLLGG